MIASSILAADIVPINTLIALDFETYFDADYTLKKQSTSEYVRDSRFETIGLGFAVVDPKTRQVTDSGFIHRPQVAAWLARHDWAATAVIAHHAHFDGLILNEHYNVRPAFWFDTMSMAGLTNAGRIAGGASLAKLAAFFRLPAKGDEVNNARGKRFVDFSSLELSAYGRYCIHDCELAAALCLTMADSLKAEHLQAIDTTVRFFTEPKLEMNRALVEQAAGEEAVRREALFARAETQPESLRSKEKFALLLLSAGQVPPMKTSAKTGKPDYAFAKSDPEFVEMLEGENETVRWLCEARVAASSSLLLSRYARFLRLSDGGAKVPIYLRVAGAHTHRWSGGDKTNFQNLPKKSALRRALLAPKGQVIVACDSTQIEARGNAWVSGQADLLAGFEAADKDLAATEDVYTRFASAAYGRRITKADKAQRSVGKVCVLGLGYQMGAMKLGATLLAGPMGAAPVIFGEAEAETMGVDWASWAEKNHDRLKQQITTLNSRAAAVHFATAAHLVDTYRRLNPAIVKFWSTCQEVLHAMVEGREMVFGSTGVFRTGRHRIFLPSGLELYYKGLEARLEEDAYGRTRTVFGYLGGATGKQWTYVYGGKLTENIVQSFSYDIVASQMVQLRALGYDIVTTTHDEIVFLANDGVQAKRDAIEVMSRRPSWCAGLPLNAEAESGDNYGFA